jgi:hypothetical protein
MQKLLIYGPYKMALWSEPMRPKARGLAQHGGPPDWLEECDPAARWYFVRDRRSMPPALTDHTTCPGLGLFHYETFTKYRHEPSHGRKAWPGTLVDPCSLLPRVNTSVYSTHGAPSHDR